MNKNYNETINNEELFTEMEMNEAELDEVAGGFIISGTAAAIAFGVGLLAGCKIRNDYDTATGKKKTYSWL